MRAQPVLISRYAQASSGTSVVENGCTLKGGVVPFGCKITTYCLEGHYPKDKGLLFTGGQNLGCVVETGERFTDEQGNVVTRFMDCVKGCIPRDQSLFRDIATRTKRQYTTVLDCDGKVVAKCATSRPLPQEACTTFVLQLSPSDVKWTHAPRSAQSSFVQRLAIRRTVAATATTTTFATTPAKCSRSRYRTASKSEGYVWLVEDSRFHELNIEATDIPAWRKPVHHQRRHLRPRLRRR